MSRSARVSVMVVALAALTAGLAFARMAQVHADTWDWALWPSRFPSKVHFLDRDYLRGAELDPPATATDCGEAPGGARIFSVDCDNVTTGIYLVADDVSTGYALSGGP